MVNLLFLLLFRVFSSETVLIFPFDFLFFFFFFRGVGWGGGGSLLWLIEEKKSKKSHNPTDSPP